MNNPGLLNSPAEINYSMVVGGPRSEENKAK
jgi:hypothetical protein